MEYIIRGWIPRHLIQDEHDNLPPHFDLIVYLEDPQDEGFIAVVVSIKKLTDGR